ncbi:MAG: transporter substrate-binding domain-containing protein [Burkholderiales bacterium]|nr:transporter substrate-binding domain-containing protein [Burkholderiales bacterium]
MGTLAVRGPWLLALLLVAASARAAEPELHLLTEQNPPFNMLVDGKVVGVATDKVRAMLERSGIRYDIELLPWKRAMEIAGQQGNACVYAAARRPEREARFKWVGPLAYDLWAFFGRSDRNYKLDKLDDAHAYTIGTYNGDVRDSFLRAKGFEVETAMDDEMNPRKLMAGRIGLWAASKTRGEDMLVKAGLDQQISALFTFYKADLYLACNLQVDDALISRLGEALGKMKQDGTAAAIEDKYLH